MGLSGGATPERPSAPELDEFRARVRKVIAEHAPAIEAREGFRAPESDDEDTQLRTWFRAMYDHGLLGADWPVELSIGTAIDLLPGSETSQRLHTIWHETVLGIDSRTAR